MVFLIKYSFVIPAFNEGDSLYMAVANFIHVASALDGGFEIIIVNDGSTDNTGQVIQELEKKFTFVSSISLLQNGGKGYALRTGFMNCDSESVVYGFIDGDLDIDSTFARQMIESIEANISDVAIASKLHILSHVDYPTTRKILSRIFRLYTRVFLKLNVTDTQTGMKFFGQDVHRNVIPLLASNSYSFDLEFLSLATSLGYSISEYPVAIRHGFSSSVGFKNSMRSILDVCAISKRLKRIKNGK